MLTIHNCTTAILFISIVAAIGCKKNDDNSAPGATPTVSRASVLGHSQKVGYYPDGSKAQALSKENLEDIQKTGEGMLIVNGATASLTKDEEQKRNDKNKISGASGFKAELIAIATSHPMVAQLISNPSATIAMIKDQLDSTTERRDKLMTEIKASCQITSSPGKATETGDENSKRVTGTSRSGIGGDKCPLASDTNIDFDFSLNKFSEKSGKVSLKGSLDSTMDLKSEARQTEYDFIKQKISGKFSGEVIVLDRNSELAGNLEFEASVKTKRQGMAKGMFLLDLYSVAVDEKSTTMSVYATVVLETEKTKALIQVQSELDKGGKPATKVFINGKEITSSNSESFFN